MAEQVKTISEARQNLTGLSETAQRSMARYLITNQGKPQSVLVGYEDYRQMQAIAELAQRPEELEKIRRGVEQVEAGRVVDFNGLQAMVKRERAAQVSTAETRRAAARAASRVRRAPRRHEEPLGA